MRGKWLDRLFVLIVVILVSSIAAVFLAGAYACVRCAIMWDC